MSNRMREILERADKVKPIAEHDGVKVVSPEDAIALQEEQMLAIQSKEDVDLGDYELNPDGTIARTRGTILAINEERRLMNKFRVKGKGRKLLQVVTDYRAVKEHSRGTVYLANVPVYEFVREETEDGEKGDLVLVSQTTVPDKVFLTEFQDSLDNASMYEVLEAVTRNQEDVSKKEMPI